MQLTRRTALAVIPLGLAGCATYQPPGIVGSQFDPTYLAMYAAVPGEPFPVPAIDLNQVDPRFFRREVEYPGNQPTGTVIVDPNARYLYLVLENGRALRYGVGVGRTEAFNFVGEATIQRKAEWPSWTPTPDMIAREPDRYGPYAGGLPGGLDNPLGARALYLYADGRDTLYRLHGTNEPWSIGRKVSSGCVRLLNQDIIDLYGRVPLGSRVFVLPSAGAYYAT
jgi:lipoprotein-anchoring transpeptidase ErfK/SrfK